MKQELKNSIIEWVNKELDGYRSECGSHAEVVQYMTEDAVGKFGDFDDEDLYYEIGTLVYKVINGMDLD